jgi:GDPmannose 4,6-dehydratase
MTRGGRITHDRRLPCGAERSNRTASGFSHFGCVGREIIWKGEGTEEVGVDNRSGVELIRIDPKYFRPTEVELLLGDPSKARKKLGWEHQTSFEDLVKEMVKADLVQVKKEGCHRHD